MPKECTATSIVQDLGKDKHEKPGEVYGLVLLSFCKATYTLGDQETHQLKKTYMRMEYLLYYGHSRMKTGSKAPCLMLSSKEVDGHAVFLQIMVFN